MRQDIILKPWQIELTTNSTNDSFEESTFFTGNGRMGIRGYLPFWQEKRTFETGLFVAGIFGEIKPGITDFVNLPTPVWGNIECDGHPITLSSPVSSTLDMKTGVRSQSFLAKSGETTLNIEHHVFCSMSDPSLLVQRLSFSSSRTSNISVHAGIHTACCNCPVPDDQVKENHETIKLAEPTQHDMCKDSVDCTFSILGTGLIVREQMSFHTSFADSEDYISDDVLGKQWCGILQSGQKLVLEVTTRITTSRDIDPLIGSNEISDTYDELFAKSSLAWASRWNESDIEIDGAPDDQSAVRYNIFQLIQAMPSADSRASIGARGLTHGRYKGCYFWDTEIFMLPMFLWTRPEDAESLLGYRYHTLPDAMESAKRFSAKGARYSWMSSDTGFEQCESWDTGCCEIHITADIAYAFYRYNSVISDEKLRNQSAEVLVQTARYWVDRFNYSAQEDRYHLLFVKGPDEYGGVTTDDFYTVCMARDNLQYAAQYVRALPGAQIQALAEKTGLTPQEPALWEEIARKVVLVRDGLLWRQDSTFGYLEPLDIAAAKDGDVPLYHTISFDRLQRYQVLKQPDVLMYMALQPERFSDAEVCAAWEYYEPRTLHDSTLSFGIHALLAARYGFARAEEFFEKSLFLDLKNVMGNTANEGIHTAALGATWQAMVLGFGGLEERDGALHVSPHLPETLTAMRYRVHWRGTRYEIRLRRGEAPSVQKL